MKKNAYELLHYYDENYMCPYLHYHDFYECIFPLQGHLTYQVGAEVFDLSRGDVLLLQPNVQHRFLSETSGQFQTVLLWVESHYFSQFSFSDDLSCCFQRKASAFHIPNAYERPFHQNLQDLIALETDDEYAKSSLAYANLLKLLILLNRSYIRSTEIDSVRKNILVEAISHYLDNHLSERISLDGIANSLFISKYYLSRKFHEETGLTIFQMLLQKRLMCACHLMISSNLSLTEISLRCGFSDYSCFYKMFHREYGISPKKYMEFNCTTSL